MNMNKDFQKVRFALFIKSYAWFILSEYIRKIQSFENTINKLCKILLFEKDNLFLFFVNKTHINKPNKIINSVLSDDEKVKIFLQVEQELITLIKEKDDKENFINEDYHHALLEPAIERVAGNNLSHIEGDRWFDSRLFEFKKKYHRWYYDIAYKYKLPTIRIVPFLLRLIS